MISNLNELFFSKFLFNYLIFRYLYGGLFLFYSKWLKLKILLKMQICTLIEMTEKEEIAGYNRVTTVNQGLSK